MHDLDDVRPLRTQQMIELFLDPCIAPRRDVVAGPLRQLQRHIELLFFVIDLSFANKRLVHATTALQLRQPMSSASTPAHHAANDFDLGNDLTPVFATFYSQTTRHIASRQLAKFAATLALFFLGGTPNIVANTPRIAATPRTVAAARQAGTCWIREPFANACENSDKRLYVSRNKPTGGR